MAVSVLVVDDSGFFRKRLTEILSASGDIQVVGVATNGREGVEMAQKLRPDVITMDYEMPVMDGITAVREILKHQFVPVLMFSSLTYDGARVTLDALDAGAVDFLPKNFEDIAKDTSQLQQILRDRILSVARSGPGTRPNRSAPPLSARPRVAPAPVRPATGGRATLQRSTPEPEQAVRSSGRKTPPRHYDVVGIGTSTGGPIALQKVLTVLPKNFPAPIVLVQHMPASFTPAFADRLNKLCNIDVREAKEGDVLKPGLALLAPGGKQMMIENRGGQGRVRILPGDERLNYKPCADVTFGSLARSFPGKTLGVILTGMGADGKEGCRLMKASGSIVWSQDEKTSVIYGMPMAVAKAGLSDEVLPLQDIGNRLMEGVS
ncbi:protein-glutamate methylesterase/protein-glutamine glutaminase [Marinobacter caseinilyticus]|uniref:protein-glutamate methylesterase/protein-glutamine glutaminase n=1 Tax=Marinobacter caseinilyticus TaxID=2692195 RepID=UPI0014086C80|nr:chemotaxis response regulator protein-glutamate methylesterase [Marinobacter caseinilyticus]